MKTRPSNRGKHLHLVPSVEGGIDASPRSTHTRPARGEWGDGDAAVVVSATAVSGGACVITSHTDMCRVTIPPGLHEAIHIAILGMSRQLARWTLRLGHVIDAEGEQTESGAWQDCVQSIQALHEDIRRLGGMVEDSAVARVGRG